MALMPCPECKTQVSDKAAACPHCGCPLTKEAAPRDKERSQATSEPPLRECPACRAMTDARAWVCQTCSRKIGPAPWTKEAKEAVEAERKRIADINALTNRWMWKGIGIILALGVILMILLSTCQGGRR